MTPGLTPANSNQVIVLREDRPYLQLNWILLDRTMDPAAAADVPMLRAFESQAGYRVLS